MSVAQMRNEIAMVYPGEGWKQKVDRMHERQVVAIYMNFQRNGKFEGKKTASGRVMGYIVPPPPPSPYHQMTIAEWLKGE